MTIKHDHNLEAEDAIRLLSNAILQIHHLAVHEEGITVPGRDIGEFILTDALEYLAHGDTAAARSLMDEYDEWRRTGVIHWPYFVEPIPPESS